MATRTSTTLQCSNSVESAAPHDAQGVSSRRLKKREIDRRCQRQARERTKSRITYLEGLVEDFRRQDSSGQVATLMKQLEDVESERDIMAKALKDIQKAMDIHKPLKASEEQQRQDTSFNKFSQMMFDDGDREERKPSIVSLFEAAPPSDVQQEPDQVNDFALANFSPAPSLHLPCPEKLFGPQVVRLESHSPQSTSQTLVQAKAISDPNLMPSSYANNWTHSLNGCSCQHSHDQGRMPGKKSVWRGNFWRYANEVLSERFDWTEDVQPATDAMADDVPVRAVLEGWDAVTKNGPLHPSWHILRRIDQTLFRTCPDTERLAILRAMHTLLQFHTESTSQRYSRLPPWYMRRPAQKIAHSYAIDYFAWPGVRERFIFSEHDYCGNEFWELFCKSLRILWPYEFRDCYTREIETGLYKISPQFDERLRDIKSWTMGPDIFQRFPELYSDMPSFNQIPASITTRASRPPSLPPAPSPKRQKVASRGKKEEQIRHMAVDFQMPTQQTIQVPNMYQYNVPDLNPMTALDAFAYGAINETEFAAMYHPEDLEGYPNITF